jgi:hypothetical protein
MRKSIAVLSGLLILSSAATAARAAVTLPFADHFTANEFGANTNKLGEIPTLWTTASDNTHLKIVDTGEGGQAMQINMSNQSAVLYFTAVTSGTLTIRMQLRIDDATDEDFSLRTGGLATYIRFRPAGTGNSDGISYYGGAADFTHEKLLLGAVNLGDWYQLDQSLDFNTKTWELSLENLTKKKGTPGAQYVDVKNISFTTPSASSVGYIQFTKVGNSFNATVDNVALQLPEPASLGMLAACGLLMLRRRRH